MTTRESNEFLLRLIIKYENNHDCTNIVTKKKILAIIDKITWKVKPIISFKQASHSTYIVLGNDFVYSLTINSIIDQYL